MNRDSFSRHLAAGLPGSRPRRLRPALGLGLLLAMAVTPTRADWLVMRDGSRIETAGTWQEQGRQIVFTLPNGTLAAVRADDVDLEASATATAQAATTAPEPTAPASSPPRQATIVLTDADFPRSNDRARESNDAEASDDAAEPDAEAVKVVTWRRSDLSSGNGLRVSGTLRNTSTDVTAGIAVNVVAYDSTGEVMLSTPATLAATSLTPGQKTTFAADLEGVFSFSRVEFDLGYVPIKTVEEVMPPASTRRPED